MNTRNGGSAFPTNTMFSENASTGEIITYRPLSDGMSLRDWFAAHAPNPPNDWRGGEVNIENAIKWRWYYADLMLKVRNE